MVGKYQTSWTQKIETTRDDEAVVDELLGWLLEVGQAGCMHTTTPGYRMFFRIETDASKYGMGLLFDTGQTPGALECLVHGCNSLEKSSEKLPR